MGIEIKEASGSFHPPPIMPLPPPPHVRTVPVLLYGANALLMAVGLWGWVQARETATFLERLGLSGMPNWLQACAWMGRNFILVMVVTYVPMLLAGASLLLVKDQERCHRWLASLVLINASLAVFANMAWSFPLKGLVNQLAP